MANTIDSNPLRALDANGNPVSGARLYVYDTGTTTPQAIFSDSALTVPASQPVVADSNGIFAPVYTAGTTQARVVVTDTSGNSLPGYPIDPAQSIPLSASGASQVSFSPTVSITSTTVQAAIEEVFSDSLQNVVEDATPQLGGPLDTNGQQVNLSKGADVASAASLTLGADGNSFDVTGTTAITSIATRGVGTRVTLQFDDALTLTHHATDLVLPGGANITTAAGDAAVFEEYAAGDWRCVSYQRADGRSVVQSRVRATAQATTSGSTVTFSGIPSGVSEVVVMFSAVSLSGTDSILVQIGDAGGLETTGYVSKSMVVSSASSSTSGFIVSIGSAAVDLNGQMTLNLMTGTTWTASHGGAVGTDAVAGGGTKTLSEELTQVAITVTGADTFDAGSVNISYR